MLVEHELDDVVLVGHSYAGMVLAGVAERPAERIGRRAAPDAFTSCNSESTVGLESPDGSSRVRSARRRHAGHPAAACDTSPRTGGTAAVTGRAYTATGVSKSAQCSTYFWHSNGCHNPTLDRTARCRTDRARARPLRLPSPERSNSYPLGLHLDRHLGGALDCSSAC